MEDLDFGRQQESKTLVVNKSLKAINPKKRVLFLVNLELLSQPPMQVGLH